MLLEWTIRLQMPFPETNWMCFLISSPRHHRHQAGSHELNVEWKKKCSCWGTISKQNVMVVVLAVTFMYSLADCRELWSRALHCDIAKAFVLFSECSPDLLACVRWLCIISFGCAWLCWAVIQYWTNHEIVLHHANTEHTQLSLDHFPRGGLGLGKRPVGRQFLPLQACT